jgi:hypothetical protein
MERMGIKLGKSDWSPSSTSDFFPENIMAKLMWCTRTDAMIHATETMVKLCNKFNVPMDYYSLGIEQDDIDESSSWTSV